MPQYSVCYRKDFQPFPNIDNYRASHYTFICKCRAEDKEDCFRKMQGEIWSPNGEAKGLILACGTDHTSMSVGDMIIDPSGECYMVMMCGFELIPDRFKD